MATEPLWYRAWKQSVQTVSTRVGRPTQLDKLAETDWDVVVVLDACRWDALDAAAHWPFGQARSPASATDEWLSYVSDAGTFEGAHIATGNVKYDNFDLGATEIAHLWRTEWDSTLGTVLPEPVLDQVNTFLDEGYRQVVGHVMPPHAPYIARLGETWLPAYPQTTAWSHAATSNTNKDDTVSAQVAMASGSIDIGRARSSYKAAVESTWQTLIPYVSQWVEQGLNVIVTADHGEVFGSLSELGLYAHPNRCHIRPLVQVPFEHFSKPTDRDLSETAEQKLQALGYAD